MVAVAVAALQRTIQLYKEKGRFRQAADRHKEIAAILQQEGGDMAGALEAYEAAGNIYSNEDATACVSLSPPLLRPTGLNSSLHRSANACYKEAAEIAATLGQYPRAIEHFEKVAQQSLGSALTRYGVKEHYLKAGMCWLATGVSLRLKSSSSPLWCSQAVETGRCLDEASNRQLHKRGPFFRHNSRVPVPQRYYRSV